MTYNKLKGRIIEKYGTASAFAAKLEKSKVSVSAKLHGKIGFSKEEILAWCELLEIPKEEIGSYFFTE